MTLKFRFFPRVDISVQIIFISRTKNRKKPQFSRHYDNNAVHNTFFENNSPFIFVGCSNFSRLFHEKFPCHCKLLLFCENRFFSKMIWWEFWWEFWCLANYFYWFCTFWFDKIRVGKNESVIRFTNIEFQRDRDFPFEFR